VKKRFPSFTILVVFVLLILCGLPLILYLNLELNPIGASSSLSVGFSWYGAEPRVIEQEVTSKLEAAFARVQGIKDINSTSGNGSGNIYVTLDKDANADVVRFEISNLIRQAWPELPQEVSFPQLSVNRPNQENERPLVSYTLNAPAGPNLLQKYAIEHIKPALSQLPGIYKIEVYGAMPLEWRLVYNTNALQSTGITPEDMEQAVRRYLEQESLGTGNVSVSPFPNRLAPYNSEKQVEAVPMVLSSGGGTALQDNVFEKELLSIPLKSCLRRHILLGDIATLEHKEEQPQSHYRINGLNTINILVYAAAGENNLALGQKVKQEMDKISKKLPTGYTLLLGDDSTQYIGYELDNIFIRTLCTLGILTLFVWSVTRKWKHALMIIMMLLGNLCIAVIFYYLFRIEIHLYTLAGITVSLGLMTDNIIIMSDHLRTQGNRKVFLAILAGTLATVSSLVVIFFLEERLKANLVDFALVIIINQAISMLTALFVIPAMMEKMKLAKAATPQPPPIERVEALNNKSNSILNLSSGRFKLARLFSLSFRELSGAFSRTKRVAVGVRASCLYQRIYLFLGRCKVIAIIIFILGFGLPVYMLPDKWEGDMWYNNAYNKTLGSEWYKKNGKPWVDKIFGGALRLFTEKVFEDSYFGNPQETSLYVTASMPRGAILEQANTLMADMEAYLKQFREIRLFQTNVSARNSSITVYFQKESLQSGFPFQLKLKVISKAIELGGADWGVFGFGDGFSNSVQENVGNYSVLMLGYNYDQLVTLAGKLKKKLRENPRIKEVYVVSERTWFKPDNTEFVAVMDKQKAVAQHTTPGIIYAAMQHLSTEQAAFAGANTLRGIENIRLQPAGEDKIDIWQLKRALLQQDTVMFKFATLSSIEKETTSPVICKENQQYRLFLQFDYIGSDKFARKYIDKTVNDFKPYVPVGYTINANNDRWFWWNQENKKQYWLLGLIVIMIFFICAILFESLLQPLAVILTIPVGFIGIFLTFYLFDLNFDQGGFAALIMLCGITVNAAIYIINDYNHLRREYAGRRVSNMTLYFKAFNYKIIPILLTVVSTVLGFVPFLIGEKQAFWFSLAAGTIGGLLFSLVGIVFYLPLFLKIKSYPSPALPK
jgi:multidrug efflux pump subunit AcrB